MNINEYISRCPHCKNLLSDYQKNKGQCGECDSEFSPEQRNFAQANPILYGKDIVLSNGAHKSVIEMADGRVSGEIKEIFGVWAVTTHGVECLEQTYGIPENRLSESDWIKHMSEKLWVNINDFESAFSEAKKMHKIP